MTNIQPIYNRNMTETLANIQQKHDRNTSQMSQIFFFRCRWEKAN